MQEAQQLISEAHMPRIQAIASREASSSSSSVPTATDQTRNELNWYISITINCDVDVSLTSNYLIYSGR